MNELDDPKIVIDKQGRICDQLGRPLRDHASRSYSGPFKGRDGSAHPKAGRLATRRKVFDDLRPEQQRGRKRPGSLKK